VTNYRRPLHTSLFCAEVRRPHLDCARGITRVTLTHL